MSRFARVVVESNLIQLDREFDFKIPEALASQLQVGQRVRFFLGRAKKLQTGFVVELLEQSDFASTELNDIVDLKIVLKPEVYRFAKQVAARQCVAIGEILTQAVPDFMPRVAPAEIQDYPLPAANFAEIPLSGHLASKTAVLSSLRSVNHQGLRFPDWAWLLASRVYEQLMAQKSSIVILPEQDQVRHLLELLNAFDLGPQVLNYLPGSKKSERFLTFLKALEPRPWVVIGTRSAIYAPVTNLGLVALFDDADDSLREQGSPYTHARELAMMRSDQQADLLLIANYRSAEVQRLCDIGYLTDLSIQLPPPRISFSEPGTRLDQASFRLIREGLDVGPVLILLPRKGQSAAIYCAGCDSKVKCGNCGGPVWEPEAGKYRCRVCQSISYSCRECGSSQIRRGRTGSARTAQEFGKSFPGAVISEATADHKPGRIKSKNHIVIATPGSAPRVTNGYSAVVILDTDVWLASPLLRAEQNAIRDWMEAIELLSDNGKALISGVDSGLGRALSLGQHRELAKANLLDLGQLYLPPTSRIVSLESDPQTISIALEQLQDIGVKVLRTNLGEPASALIRFSYAAGPQVAGILKSLALRTNARLVGGNKRRGLKIVMDDPVAL